MMSTHHTANVLPCHLPRCDAAAALLQSLVHDHQSIKLRQLRSAVAVATAEENVRSTYTTHIRYNTRSTRWPPA